MAGDEDLFWRNIEVTSGLQQSGSKLCVRGGFYYQSKKSESKVNGFQTRHELHQVVEESKIYRIAIPGFSGHSERSEGSSRG